MDKLHVQPQDERCDETRVLFAMINRVFFFLVFFAFGYFPLGFSFWFFRLLFSSSLDFPSLQTTPLYRNVLRSIR